MANENTNKNELTKAEKKTAKKEERQSKGAAIKEKITSVNWKEVGKKVLLVVAGAAAGGGIVHFAEKNREINSMIDEPEAVEDFKAMEYVEVPVK